MNKQKNKAPIGLFTLARILIKRGDGVENTRMFYGVYDLIFECGGNAADSADIIEKLNAGEWVHFGTLRAQLVEVVNNGKFYR